MVDLFVDLELRLGLDVFMHVGFGIVAWSALIPSGGGQVFDDGVEHHAVAAGVTSRAQASSSVRTFFSSDTGIAR